MTCLFGLDHEFAFEFPPVLDCLDLCVGGLFRSVDQTPVEREGYELQASVADDLAAGLPFAASGAEPVLVILDELLNCESRRDFFRDVDAHGCSLVILLLLFNGERLRG